MESKPDSFACPSCATRLRLGPTLFAQKQIPCPECATDLLVEHSASGIRVALFVAETQDAPTKLPAVVARFMDSPWRTQWLAGAVTSVVALTISILVLTGPDDSNRVSAKPTQVGESQPETPESIAALDESNTAELAKDSAAGTTDNGSLAPDNQSADASDDTNSTDNETVAAVPDGQKSDVSKPVPQQTDDGTNLPLPKIKQVTNIENASQSDDKVKPASIDVPDANTGIPNNGQQQPVESGPTKIKSPIEEPVVEPPRPLGERLAQPLGAFKQATPVPLSAIVDIVEELVQAPVSLDASIRPALDTPVVLSLDKTTPLDLLKHAVVRANLKVVVADDSIRLETLK